MITGIDHLVIVVPDLPTAVTHYEKLGFNVVLGGRHPIGTHNALIGFKDGSYVELIAFFEPNAGHRWYRHLGQGGGLVDYCLATDGLVNDTRLFREANLALSDPRPLSRTRPDGYELRWVLAVADDAHQGAAPFLIEDETPRTERVPRQTDHPNRVTGIKTLTVAVSDPAPVRRWFAKVLGSPGEAIVRTDLEATGLSFMAGPHALEFVSPRAGEGPLAGPLRERGHGPWAATLRTAGGRPGPLDPARALGARLSLE